MEEENSNSTISLHRPNNMSAESQSLDGALPEVGVLNIDTPEPIHEVDGSPQLVGVQVVIAEDSVGVEVKAEVNLTKIVGEKSKRGRPPRVQAKPPPVKKEEDVCFICFDGGSLVLCDRRGSSKAYHPACIKRDEEFFRSKARWNCGGTRIVVPGNFPIGCIPVYLTSFPNTNPRAYNEFVCLRGLNQFARRHNYYLKRALALFRIEFRFSQRQFICDFESSGPFVFHKRQSESVLRRFHVEFKDHNA